jgi:hypothetical protein
MFKALAYSTVLSTALIGYDAFAQAIDDGNRPFISRSQPAQIQVSQASKPDAEPAQRQVAEASPQTQAGTAFVTRQAITQWRVPKLIGVAVYGPDEKQIGKIKDVLIDHNGAAQTVVIGVGGFLGFGTKDVAVPFAAIQWRTEGRKVLATDNVSTNPIASTAGQSAGPPPMKETDPAATEASQGYPDKAILGVTVADLKSAPDFHYAPSPLADLDARSAPSNDTMRKTTP